MLEFLQAVMAASSFGSFLQKMEFDWRPLPFSLKWRAGYLFWHYTLLVDEAGI
jgi:hypothetical protein